MFKLQTAKMIIALLLPVLCAAGSGSVPLTVEDVSGAKRQNEQVTFGVPFKQGELTWIESLNIKDPAGTAVACEKRVLTRWPDGSVKWALLDSSFNAEANKKQVYALEWGKSGERVKPEYEVKVTEDIKRITVNTGVLEFSVRKDRFTIIEGVKVNGKEILKEGLEQESFVELEHTGPGATDEENWLRPSGGGSAEKFFASLDKTSYSAKVEEQNPLRAVIKISGTHVSQEGRDFGPYNIRITASAGQSSVKLVHNIVYNGNPKNDYIRALGLNIPFMSASEKKVRLCADTELDSPLKEDETYSMLSIGREKKYHGVRKEDVNPVEFNINRFSPAGTERLKVGVEPLGACAILTPEGSYGVAVRDYWKLHPKELFVSPAGISVMLWPSRGGKVLDLRRYADTAVYEVRNPGEGRRYEANVIGSAVGLGRSHEMEIAFSGNDTLDIGSEARKLNEPLLPFINPEWYANSLALGKFSVYDPVKNPKLEGAADCSLEWILRNRKLFGWHGFIDYGDLQMDFYGQWGPTRKWGWKNLDANVDNCWLSRGYSGWLNGEGIGDHTFYIHYLRTGNRKYYLLAEAYTRHIMEVDSVHWEDAESMASDNKGRSRIGGGHRHAQNHWGDQITGYGSCPNGAIDFYCLTGDLRAMEVIREYAEFQFRNQNYENEEYAAALIRYWELTGDGKYRDRAKQLVEQIDYKLNYQDKTFRYAHSQLTGAIFYHQITNDQRMKEHLIAEADEFLQKVADGTLTTGETNMLIYRAHALAYVYSLTGDKKYLPSIQKWIDRINWANRLDKVDLKNTIPQGAVALEWKELMNCVIQLQGITPERLINHVWFLNEMPYMMPAVSDMGKSW